MFTVFCEVNTAPAMPKWLGKRIWVAPRPVPNSDHSCLVFSSLRNKVARSASSILVTEAMIFCSKGPRLISAESSDTTLRKSISWARFFSMSSINWKVFRAKAAWLVMAPRISRSALSKWPRCLLSIWATPITWPVGMRMGAHRMLRVLKPVCWSTR